jgi:selenide,water dikinase
MMACPPAAGGLLAAVPAEAAEQCVADLRAAGYQQAAVVARVADALPPGSTACIQLTTKCI